MPKPSPSGSDISHFDPVNTDPTAGSFTVEGMSDDEGGINREKKQNQDEDAEYNNKNAFEQAVPMDKIRNGMETASKFFNWGYNNLKEGAKKVNAELEKNENVQNLKSKIEPTLHSLSENFNEKVRPKVNESVQKLNENVTDLYERSKPTFTEAYNRTKDGLEKAYDGAKKTVENLNKPKE